MDVGVWISYVVVWVKSLIPFAKKSTYIFSPGILGGFEVNVIKSSSSRSPLSPQDVTYWKSPSLPILASISIEYFFAGGVSIIISFSSSKFKSTENPLFIVLVISLIWLLTFISLPFFSTLSW